MKMRAVFVLTMLLGFALLLTGQSSPVLGASVSVPPVIQFSNIAADENGAPLSGTVAITFSLYNNSQSGAALWMETQSVQLDGTGHYSVYLGITQANGIPASLFTGGEAHWLGVKIAGQPEQQPRIFLVSVPYAMKAGDAATVGGLPPSAFVLAGAPGANSNTASGNAVGSNNESSTPASSDVTTSGGTVGSVPLWDATTDIDSSVITQSGSGSTAKIGINISSPTTTLDVKGAGTIRGALTVQGTLALPATGTATAGGGKNSQPLNMTASAFDSSTSTAVNQTFQWQAQPAGNDTGTTSGTLSLLFGQGTSKPTQTGLSIASNGQITFANGQTFPGTGSGTVTSVASGTGLTGGPITGSGTLQIDPTVVPELGAASNTFAGSITAGSFTGNGAGLTNVNAATLNGQTAGSFATLGANTFTGNQTVNTDILLPSVNSSGTQGVIIVGGNAFAFGTPYNSINNTGGNAFLGFAGNTTTTGNFNIAAGLGALASNTTGSYNTASGDDVLINNTSGSYNTATGGAALFSNTTGASNTASGLDALASNTSGNFNVGIGSAAGNPTNFKNATGSNNTFVGSSANPGANTAITNATAIGANAQVTANNSLVLGSINGVNGATASTNVGIGTTTPAYSLDVFGTGHFTQAVTFGSPVTFASGQTFPGTGTVTSVASGTGLTGGPITGSGTLSLASNACAAGNALTALPFTCSAFASLGANTFTGNQTVSGSVIATGVVTGGSFQIGSNPFDYGSYSNANAFLGFAGNSTMTGDFNTGVGLDAIYNDTAGNNNTAVGYLASPTNTTGSFNTATGGNALGYNSVGNGNTANGYTALNYVTGSYNTGLGYSAGPDNRSGTVNNATAIGAFADVTQSNSLVLGAITGKNGCSSSNTPPCQSINVGIGTTAPTATLDVEVNSAAPATPQVIWLKNNATISSNTPGNSVDIRFTPDGGGSVGSPNAYIRAQEDGGSGDFGTSLQFAAVNNGNASGAIERMRITSSGNVGIGTESPDNLLSVNGGADKPGGGSWGTFSDRRLKNLDGTFRSGLSQIMQINPVLYRYKEENAMGITDRQEHVGVVAQDVQKVIPEAVSENSKGYLLVNNDPVIWAMLNAIKEQQTLIERQQKQIARLTSRVKTIQATLKTKTRTGSQIRSTKAEGPAVRQ